MKYEHPTKEQRLQIYNEVLQIILPDPEAFLCNNILKAYERMFNCVVTADNTVLKLFTEFADHKPDFVKWGESWFKSIHRDKDIHEKRIIILRKCIDEIINPERYPFTKIKYNKNKKTGIKLISEERDEQIIKHNRSVYKDVLENTNKQLCIGAIAMLSAAPYLFPANWDKDICDKMVKKSYKERLIIAGALLAAEIDRIQIIDEN